MHTIKRTLAVGRALARFGARFANAQRGNVALIFGIVMPCLLMVIVGGVDLQRASTVRANVQDALDAAALAAARSQHVAEEDLTRVGLAALKANLAAFPDIELREDLTHFKLDGTSIIVADTTVEVDAIMANIILPPYGQLMDDYLPISTRSEVKRASENIEVALVLDVTGSMEGSRLTALKAASADLVKIVVQDVQTPYTSRMSIIPYSVGVNLGDRADKARGTPVAPTPITDASWQVGAAKPITGVTANNPVVVTANDHGFVDGDYVWISNLKDVSDINKKIFQVANPTRNTFQLKGVNGSDHDEYKKNSKGDVTKCKVSDCSIVITSRNHGLTRFDPDNGHRQAAYISDVAGLTSINKRWFQIDNVQADSFSIGVAGPGSSAYLSGGSVMCGRDGCPTRYFLSVNGTNDYRKFPIETCATERVGTHAYTDVAPVLAKTGRLYSNWDSGNLCPRAEIQSLTSVRQTLTDLIDSLEARGTTAGHIGLAWGWYTLAPTFNSLWSGNGADPYSTSDTIKTVIMMTDGEFNTNYCSGILASNAPFGGANRIANCMASNGDPYAQMAALCTAMKQRGIIIYTVGFEIAANGFAAQSLRSCATSSTHAFISKNGKDLADDFAAIGREITRLRIYR